jgi:hypothetical protein
MKLDFSAHADPVHADPAQATAAEIEVAADAMRIVWENENDCRVVNWFLLAQVALEAVSMLKGKAVSPPPEMVQ